MKSENLQDFRQEIQFFFMADKEDRAAYYAGQIRTELGERLDLIEKMLTVSVMSTISQCLKETRRQKKIGLT